MNFNFEETCIKIIILYISLRLNMSNALQFIKVNKQKAFDRMFYQVKNIFDAFDSIYP